jgi:hypothetical protein
LIMRCPRQYVSWVSSISSRTASDTLRAGEGGGNSIPSSANYIGRNFELPLGAGPNSTESSITSCLKCLLLGWRTEQLWENCLRSQP